MERSLLQLPGTTLTELPQDLQPRNTAEKQNAFWVVIVYFQLTQSSIPG